MTALRGVPSGPGTLLGARRHRHTNLACSVHGRCSPRSHQQGFRGPQTESPPTSWLEDYPHLPWGGHRSSRARPQGALSLRPRPPSGPNPPPGPQKKARESRPNTNLPKSTVGSPRPHGPAAPTQTNVTQSEHLRGGGVLVLEATQALHLPPSPTNNLPVPTFHRGQGLGERNHVEGAAPSAPGPWGPRHLLRRASCWLCQSPGGTAAGTPHEHSAQKWGHPQQCPQGSSDAEVAKRASAGPHSPEPPVLPGGPLVSSTRARLDPAPAQGQAPTVLSRQGWHSLVGAVPPLTPRSGLQEGWSGSPGSRPACALWGWAGHLIWVPGSSPGKACSPGLREGQRGRETQGGAQHRTRSSATCARSSAEPGRARAKSALGSAGRGLCWRSWDWQSWLALWVRASALPQEHKRSPHAQTLPRTCGRSCRLFSFVKQSLKPGF